MPYVVYVLLSERDGRQYVGVTERLERRLHEHAVGAVVSTRYRRPLNLLYTEDFADKGDAWKREKFLKSGKGREWLRQRLR